MYFVCIKKILFLYKIYTLIIRIYFKSMKKATETSFILLSQINELWQEEVKVELAKYNLTNAEFVVMSSLLWLAEQQEQVTQVNVCTYSNTKPMNTSIVLRKMQILRKCTSSNYENPSNK